MALSAALVGPLGRLLLEVPQPELLLGTVLDEEEPLPQLLDEPLLLLLPQLLPEELRDELKDELREELKEERPPLLPRPKLSPAGQVRAMERRNAANKR